MCNPCSFRLAEKNYWVEFDGVSLHDSLDGFGGSGEHLALLLFGLQNAGQSGNGDSFDGCFFVFCLVVSAVMAVSVVTATSLKFNPLFHSLILVGTVDVHMISCTCFGALVAKLLSLSFIGVVGRDQVEVLVRELESMPPGVNQIGQGPFALAISTPTFPLHVDSCIMSSLAS